MSYNRLTRWPHSPQSLRCATQCLNGLIYKQHRAAGRDTTRRSDRSQHHLADQWMWLSFLEDFPAHPTSALPESPHNHFPRPSAFGRNIEKPSTYVMIIRVTHCSAMNGNRGRIVFSMGNRATAQAVFRHKPTGG